MAARDQLFSALFNARNRVRFAMDGIFKPLGITDATWRTLFYLEQTGNGVTQKHLASVMGIEGPSLVRLLDYLESRHLVERRAVDSDRRSKSVHLTPTAVTLLVELHKLAAEVRQTMLADIPDDDLEKCLSVLQRIAGTSENPDASDDEEGHWQTTVDS